MQTDLTSPDTNLDQAKSSILQEGDIVFARTGASVGKTYIYNKNDGLVYFAGFLIRVRVKPEYNVDFVFQNTLTKNYAMFINITSQRSGQPGVNAQEYASFTFLTPTLPEQARIGAFFRHLDRLVALHQCNCNMATRPCEWSSGLRAIAWEQRKCKNVCSISTGKSNTQDHVENGRYPFYVRSPIVERSNRYLFDEEAVLTVGDGVGTGKVFHYINGKYDLHQRVYRMYDFSQDVSAKYFYYYFSKNFYDRVMAMTAKTSVDSVRYEMIAEMDLNLPKIQEQRQIASFFSHLDHLVTLHQRKHILLT